MNDDANRLPEEDDFDDEFMEEIDSFELDD